MRKRRYPAIVAARFSDEEKRIIYAKASLYGYTVSQWIRIIVLEKIRKYKNLLRNRQKI